MRKNSVVRALVRMAGPAALGAVLVACPPNDLLLDVQQKVNTAQSGGEPVAIPVFSPAPGPDGTYSSPTAFSVEITCTTDGATIYYTTDNSTPTASTTEYAGPIALVGNVPTVIKAIGVKTSMKDSDLAQATYTITYPTVTYYGNGNTEGTAPAAVAYPAGQVVSVADCGLLKKTNYVFAGWNTASDGTGTAYIPDSSLAVGTTSVALYAQWRLLWMTASGGTAGDKFGWGLAIGNSDKTVVVGAYGTNSNQGAAYVFENTGSEWSQTKLVASDGANGDYFGFSNAISSDGNTVVVGACEKQVSTNAKQGAVYVFTRSGGTWGFDCRLLAPDGTANDQFGKSVALSGDGVTLVVGASGGDAAYVFNRSDGTWSASQTLSGAAGEWFGYCVAFSRDGSTLVIGAPHNSQAYTNQGAAYVYTKQDDSWSRVESLAADDAASNDYFAQSLAVSLNGATVVVGAPFDDSLKGSCYVFTGSAGSWNQTKKLVANDGVADDNFSYSSVALWADGTTLVAGAYNKKIGSNTAQGAAYVFTNSGTWGTPYDLTASDGAANDFFGASVAASTDGSMLIVGAHGRLTSQGAAYVFYESAGTWKQE